METEYVVRKTAKKGRSPAVDVAVLDEREESNEKAGNSDETTFAILSHFKPILTVNEHAKISSR